MAAFVLADRCPRLALAHSQRRAELAADRDARARARRKHQDAQRLVAHRELQLLRAGKTCDARYIKRRQDKLDRAREMLAMAEREMARVAA